MFNNFNMRRFAAIVAMVMTASFVIAALIFFSTGGVNAVLNFKGDSQNNIDIVKEFNVEEINNISVDTSSIDIRFIPEKRKDVRVHLTGYTTADEPSFNAAKSNDTLEIYARTQNNGVINIGFNVISLKLNIYLPEDYSKNIKIRTSSGDTDLGKLKVENFIYHASSGDLDGEEFSAKSSNIVTSSGRIKLNGFGGDMELKTSSGDVIIDYMHDSASTGIDTSSGEVTLKNFTGDLNARSQSGDLKVGYSRFSNNISLKSSSGEIDLVLPADSQFGIKASTSSGDIRTDFPVTQSGKIDEDRLEGFVGSSSNQILIVTSSGDVNIGN